MPTVAWPFHCPHIQNRRSPTPHQSLGRCESPVHSLQGTSRLISHLCPIKKPSLWKWLPVTQDPVSHSQATTENKPTKPSQTLLCGSSWASMECLHLPDSLTRGVWGGGDLPRGWWGFTVRPLATHWREQGKPSLASQTSFFFPPF